MKKRFKATFKGAILWNAWKLTGSKKALENYNSELTKYMR